MDGKMTGWEVNRTKRVRSKDGKDRRTDGKRLGLTSASTLKRLGF